MPPGRRETTTGAESASRPVAKQIVAVGQSSASRASTSAGSSAERGVHDAPPSPEKSRSPPATDQQAVVVGHEVAGPSPRASLA